MTQHVSDEQYFAQMERELLAEVEEGYPESWDYKTIPTIAGIVRNKREASFERDGVQQKQNIAVIQDSTGRKQTVWMTSVLGSIFRREDVTIGDYVAIKYEGTRTPEGGGNDYHDFKVAVRKPEGTKVDWSDPGKQNRRSGDSGNSGSGGGNFVPADADFQGADDDIPF